MTETQALLLAIADELDRREHLQQNCGDKRMATSPSGVSGAIRTVVRGQTEPATEPEPQEDDDPEHYHTWPA